MRRLAAALAVWIVLAAGSAGAMKYSLLPSMNLSPEQLAKLLEPGQMVLIQEDERGNLQLVTAGIVIDAPPDEVLAAIADFENFPKFMPSTEKVEVLSREGDTWRVRFKINFQFSVLKFPVQYVLLQHFVPGHGIWWELESGDIAKSVGSWEVIPLEGGKKSAAIYSVLSDIRSVSRLVRYFIDKEPAMDVAINSSTCVLVLKALRAHVETGAYRGKTGAPAPTEP